MFETANIMTLDLHKQRLCITYMKITRERSGTQRLSIKK